MARANARSDALLVVIALCLLGVWLYVKRVPTEAPTLHPFDFLEEALPEHLEVTTPQQSIVLFASPASDRETRYQIRGKTNIPVDETTLDRLFRTLKDLEVVRDVPQPVSSKELGLATPALRLSFSLRNQTYRISLGSNCPSPEKSRYALLSHGNDERIVVLSPQTVISFDISPEQLINHQIINWLPSEVNTLKISRNYRDITITQQKNGRFVLESVPSKWAKRGPVEQVLLALTELKVNFYLDVSPPAISPIEQSLNVSLTSNDDRHRQTVLFSFGGRCPKDPSLTTITVTEKETRFGCIEPSLLLRIPQTAEEVEDNSLFFLRYDEVEKLTVKAQNNAFTLERQGTAFRLVSPKEREVTLAAGNQLLEALVSTHGRAMGLCDSAKVASSTIQLRSGLVGKKSFFDETLRIGPKLPTLERLVCREDNQMFLVGPKPATALELDPSMLDNPRLLNAAYESVDDITVVRANLIERLNRNSEGKLVLTIPKAPGDPASIESLTERLAQLTAERMLPRSRLEELRTRSPSITVRFSVKADGADTRLNHELKLYRTEEPYVIATLDDTPSPFVIADFTFELLDGLLVDRSMYRLTEQDHAFSLSRRTDQIHCTKTENAFLCPGSKLSESQIERIVNELSQLRAVRVDSAKGEITAEAMVLKVYTKENKEPRVTLKIYDSAQANLSTLYVAEPEKPKFRFYYRRAELSELFSVFEKRPTSKGN